jgi:hypothetical protein
MTQAPRARHGTNHRPRLLGHHSALFSSTVHSTVLLMCPPPRAALFRARAVSFSPSSSARSFVLINPGRYHCTRPCIWRQTHSISWWLRRCGCALYRHIRSTHRPLQKPESARLGMVHAFSIPTDNKTLQQNRVQYKCRYPYMYNHSLL